MTGAVFIDLSKAFDALDHAHLLSKLSSYSIKDRDLSLTFSLNLLLVKFVNLYVI